MKNSRSFRSLSFCCAGVALVFTLTGFAQAVSFEGIGYLPGHTASNATGVSADGSVVFGYASNTVAGPSGPVTTNPEAFRWTVASKTMQGLGGLKAAPFASYANGANADGSVILGSASTSAGSEAFRWTAAGMISLGDLPGGDVGFDVNSQARGVSADGLVVVGDGAPDGLGGGSRACRWSDGTAASLAALDAFASNAPSSATGVSADGKVIVGRAGDASDTTQAVRWDQTGAILGLGFLPGGEQSSSADAVSADGLVIVGSAADVGFNFIGFRWTTAGGMQPLADLPGGDVSCEALATSGDGAVSVGFGTTETSDFANNIFAPSKAVRWVAAGPAQSIETMLVYAGVNLTGWALGSATGISADGKVIVGQGTHNGVSEGWIISGADKLIMPIVEIPTAPTLKITGKNTVKTEKSTFTLKGTTSGKITSVTVKLGKKTLKAQGTTSWSLKLKNLKPGKNKLTIVATGPGGTSAPVKITVIRLNK